MPRSSSSAPRFYREAGLDDVEVQLNSIGDDDLPAGVRRGPRGVLPEPMPRHCPTSSADGSSATRSGCSTRRTRRWSRSTRARRGSSIDCASRAPSTSPASGLTSTPSGIGYRIEPGLVRGLDYYTRTAFEFYPRGGEGQQSALGGGGRYDGLVELLGRSPDPGDRLRDRARSGRARDPRTRPPPRRISPVRSRSSSAPIRPGPSSGLPSPRSSGRPVSLPGRSSVGASLVGSSRRPPATARTSR